MLHVFPFSVSRPVFLFTSTQYSCLWTTKSTAQSTQEAVWQGTRGSFSNIFFLSPPFLCISTLVSVGRGGVNQPPTSISNSLCSPHASRGSDLMLPRRKADPYNVSQRDGASGLMSSLGCFCKHTADCIKEVEGGSAGVWTFVFFWGKLGKKTKTNLPFFKLVWNSFYFNAGWHWFHYKQLLCILSLLKWCSCNFLAKLLISFQHKCSS